MNFCSKTPLLAITVAAFLGLYSCGHKAENPSVEFSKHESSFKKGPGQFIEAHRLIRTLDGKDKPDYTAGDRMAEFNKAFAQVKSRPGEAYEWIERGPGNVGGRTRGLIIDPADTTSRTWFLGSVGGGVWHTTDAGENWELLTNDFTTLATSALAMAPSNQDVIYVGTGEGFGNIDGIVGTGIWKSEDRGKTWRALESTMTNNFANITRIVINPENENEVIVSTRTTNTFNAVYSYIYKTTDGGETWDEKFQQGNNAVQQLVASPQSFDTIYATVNSQGILRSVNAGETWSYVWNAPNAERRIEMAISPKNPNIIYLSCEIADGSRLYYTDDAFNTSIQAIYSGRQPNWLVGQGWYDNTIAVHPYNDSIVWVAGQGPMMALKVGTQVGTLRRFGGYNNLASFIRPIADSPFADEPAGQSSTLFDGLPVSLQITDEDIVGVEIRFGQGISSKAHLISVNVATFEFNYEKMVDVPFQAWDNVNNRQIAMSVFDVDGNGEWTFQDYTNQSQPFHDVVATNNVAYSDTANVIIAEENPLYKSLYYIFMGKSPSYSGPTNELPFGIIFFNTKNEDGLISTFDMIADGYRAYSDISNVGTKGVHVDHHNIVMIPKDSATGLFYVLNANDGGIAFSEDSGETFRQTGDSYNQDGNFNTIDGYNTSQFYGIDKKNGENRYIGGTQDNGSWISGVEPDLTSNWTHAPSGDGFEAAWHYLNPSLILETSQRNNLYKSYDEGLTWSRVTLPESSGPFITRLASSQLNPDLVFMVSDTGILRSADFAETWELIDMPDNWDFQSSWGPPITISLADPDYVWCGSRMNADSRMFYSSDGGLSFQGTSAYTLSNIGLVTGIATHPNDPNTAYILFSQKNAPKILKTTDLGKTWTDLTGFAPNATRNGFPNVATYCLLVMPWDENIMWAGTEIGLFESIDGGETWEYANNGLPALSIWQMKIVNDEIVFATHGRGIWTINTEQLIPTSTQDAIVSPVLNTNIYPNPTDQWATLTFDLENNEMLNIGLYSIGGNKLRQLHTGMMNKGTHRLNVEKANLSSGVYLVNIKSAKGEITKKLIFQ